ncbi:MAG: hypothetical protein JEZ04_05265 [Spirochaetales bacterium]|nr:hypothetical protein [Spirochaetales bacterium]
MSNPDDKAGFFSKIFSFLIQASDPERDKKKQLKEIYKQINKHKYNFYKPKSDEALSALAKFVYEIYTIIGPAKVLLDHAEASVVLKTIIIENSLSDEQLNIRASFEESEIREAVKKDDGDVKQVTESLKSNLVNFFSLFETQKVQSINATYNLMTIFLDFISFDFYFFLRKFDSRFPENDFTYNPRFEDINGEYIADDLKDFLVLIPFLDLDAAWEDLFDVLSSYKGAEVLNRKDWLKMLKKIRDVRMSKILDLVVQSIEKDPSFSYKAQRPSNRIVEDYLTKLKNQVELTIQKILKEKRSSKIDNLAFKIFGTNAVSRMKFYTDKANLAFAKKMLGGYTYIMPMNYLKAFLVDYCKKDIREICDILLIRGKWTTNISSQQLSEAFYGLMSTADELIIFDERLSEEGEKGVEITKLLKRRDADKSNIQSLRKSIKEVNDDAQRLINTTGLHLVSIAKSFKLVIEDYQKKPHELLTNWKELEPLIEGGVVERMSEVYRKCYYFVQLLQFFNKNGNK